MSSGTFGRSFASIHTNNSSPLSLPSLHCHCQTNKKKKTVFRLVTGKITVPISGELEIRVIVRLQRHIDEDVRTKSNKTAGNQKKLLKMKAWQQKGLDTRRTLSSATQMLCLTHLGWPGIHFKVWYPYSYDVYRLCQPLALSNDVYTGLIAVNELTRWLRGSHRNMEKQELFFLCISLNTQAWMKCNWTIALGRRVHISKHWLY